MKWIGQHIWSFISRFRSKVFVESGDIEVSKVSGQPTVELSAWSTTATSAHAGRVKFLKSGTAAVDTFTAGNHTTSGEVLGRIEAYGVNDADGETLSSYIEFANDSTSDADSSPGIITFATSDADDAGTPTARLTIDDGGVAKFDGNVIVSPGNNLTFDSVSLTGIQTSAESFVDDDISIMTSGAVADKIEAYGYSTTTGDITSVIGGTNINVSGGTSGDATVNLDNPIAGPIEIEQGASGGGSALLIDNDDIDAHALKIEADNTTAHTFVLKSTALTTGCAQYVNVDSLTTGCAMKFDVDDALTTSATKDLVIIDYDKAGVTASGQTSITTGLDINLADGATNHASGAVTMIGAQVDVDSANAQGTITQKGLILNVAADGTGDAATTSGIEMEVMDGGTDIKMMSHADTADYCSIGVTTNGATTITTVDGGAAAANFEVAADGNITLDAAGDIALECGGGDLTCDADTVTFESANADDPIVTIKNTYNDANSMASLNFVNDRGDAPSVGTNLAEIYFTGEDSGQNSQEYGRILCEIDVLTHGQESGVLKFGVANHDGGNGYGLIMTGGSVNDEVDVTVGLGAASVVTIPGDIDLAGDIDVDGTLETDALTVGGVAFTPSTTVQVAATKQVTHHMIKDDIGTGVIYIGLQEADAESSSIANKNLPLLAPAAGKLLKIFLRTVVDMSGADLTWRLYTRAASATTGGTAVEIGAKTVTGPTDTTMVTYDFTSSLDSGTNAIAAGDKVQISVQADASSSDSLFFITCLWEWDFS